jgi:hypothetical protein
MRIRWPLVRRSVAERWESAAKEWLDMHRMRGERLERIESRLVEARRDVARLEARAARLEASRDRLQEHLSGRGRAIAAFEALTGLSRWGLYDAADDPAETIVIVPTPTGVAVSNR